MNADAEYENKHALSSAENDQFEGLGNIRELMKLVLDDGRGALLSAAEVLLVE